MPSIWLRTATLFHACTVPGADKKIGTSCVFVDATVTGIARGGPALTPALDGARCHSQAAATPASIKIPTSQSHCLDLTDIWSVVIIIQIHETSGVALTDVKVGRTAAGGAKRYFPAMRLECQVISPLDVFLPTA
jgi:hypothetical protein